MEGSNEERSGPSARDRGGYRDDVLQNFSRRLSPWQAGSRGGRYGGRAQGRAGAFGQHSRGRGRHWYEPTKMRGRGRAKPLFEGPQKVGKEGRKTGGAEAEQNTTYRPAGSMLTIEEIESDSLTTLARQNWSKDGAQPPFDPALVTSIYNEELHGTQSDPPGLRRIMMLEISQYLEKYLIPNYGETASREHVLSMIVMLNEKFRENVPAWEGFSDFQHLIPVLFKQLCELQWQALQLHQQVSFLVFFIHAFQSLENDAVSKQVLKLVQLPLWHSLSPGRRQLEMHVEERIEEKWRALERRAKKEAKKAAETGAGFVQPESRPEATFLAGLVDNFTKILEEEGSGEEEDAEEEMTGPNGVANGAGGHPGSKLAAQRLLFCERFVELLVDLMSQAPTRRYSHALLEDKAVLIKCKMSHLFRQERGHLFRQLVDLFQFYMAFPISNFDSEPVGDQDMMAAHYARVQQLQMLLFYKHPALKELALNSCATVASRKVLLEHVQALQHEELRRLVTRELRLCSEQDPWADRPEFLQEVLVSAYEKRKSQTETINAMPLYPTERILWDESQIPDIHFTGETCLALPKLNLQFLTAHDYLLRNFNLFRLEATYEIREDIADVLKRIGADRDDEDNLIFKGWARMAVPIQQFSIIEVSKPNVGENKPASVEADIIIDTKPMRGDVRGEWDGTKQHDVLFLLSISPPDAHQLLDIRREAEAARGPGAQPTPDQLFGLTAVRGCEVIEVKDEEGKLMNDFSGRTKPNEVTFPEGFQRTITVALDTAQYQLDMDAMQERRGEDVYGTFCVLMRRKPKENNFKAVLESIRDLMNEDTIIPDWLTNIFLGYGDPAGAQYTSIVEEKPEAFISSIDFKDTFLDVGHLQTSFPDYDVEVVNNSGGPEPVRPFKVTFPLPAKREERKGRKRKAGEGVAAEPLPPAARPKLLAESYAPRDPGPYPQDKPPENSVRFTPVQVGAILSGVQPGLTMVVGPPGTGKTDTAVQIMHVLYHNQPDQRTLLITHSNQALNDLFEKLLQRDVPSRYLLRLGMGEAELQTEDDFSRAGRVNTMLARRIQLLAEVERMAKHFKVAEDVAYTCETAAHFWLLHVLARWEKFLAQVRERKESAECVQEAFPFKEYFADAGDLFRGTSCAEDMEKARGCFRHLKTIFQELEECRAFELLKGQADRIKYLQTKQAKIVAMTCTHAALKRREFLDIGFKYDNLLMEESAQILEIESFIPMLLQRQEDGVSRLKRLILIGDHHQLPPVVKNMAFQKYSHLDQSLFTRFVRLGTPFVQLNAQGRARPSLAELYNWRYRELGDLPNVSSAADYVRANPGFAWDYQFVDVGDVNGRGESEPIPYFYQNLAEAEYVVATFQYMRLRGYPANKISILTTYNGQKALIRDVVERRCAPHPAFGRPRTVQTVDKYQGQQNDYILLSLVRTRAVGHLRDVRRLVVAMSRSRLGLYVFGRQPLFANCYELRPTFQKLLARPTQLALHPQEYWLDCQRKPEDADQATLVPNLEAMGSLVTAMAREWEVATHNAAVAEHTKYIERQREAQQSLQSAQQPATDTEASVAAAGEAGAGPPEDSYVIEDLVAGIAEKPDGQAVVQEDG